MLEFENYQKLPVVVSISGREHHEMMMGAARKAVPCCA